MTVRAADAAVPASPLVGVVGGAGPLATACFLETVVRLTEGEHDQDHVDMVVLQHASTPDRTAHILGLSEQDPGPVMAEDAGRLERWGAGFVVVPCNTAHHYLAQIAGAVAVPVLSIVDETVAAVLAGHPGASRVGVLATEGTIASRVYQQALAERGVDAVVPGEAVQGAVSSLVYDGVKAGRAVDPAVLAGLATTLLDEGADAVVLGCTELSVVAAHGELLRDGRLVDSLDSLARATIRLSGHRVRSDRGPAAVDRAAQSTRPGSA